MDSNSAAPSVRFTVDSQKLTVKPANGVNNKDQAEVESNMHSKVLESSTYPKIVFESSEVRRIREGAWKVSGNLTLHGATKPVVTHPANRQRSAGRRAETRRG